MKDLVLRRIFIIAARKSAQASVPALEQATVHGRKLEDLSLVPGVGNADITSSWIGTRRAGRAVAVVVDLDLVVDDLAVEPGAQTCGNLDLVEGGHGGGEERGEAGGRSLRVESQSRRHRRTKRD